MPRITTADIQRLQESRKDQSRGWTDRLRGIPGALRDLYRFEPSEAIEDVERIERLAGLPVGIGTTLGAQALVGKGLLPPSAPEEMGFPDYRNIPGAASAFFDDAIRGDFDAAIPAFQDEMDAGPGFWGASELIAGALGPGALAKVGTGVIRTAPKVGGAFARFAPQATQELIERGGTAAATGLGQTLRAPWLAEEALGRGIVAGARTVLPSRVTRLFPGGRTAEPEIDLAEELLGPPPPTAPTAPPRRAPTELFPGEGEIAPRERLYGTSPYETPPIGEVDIPKPIRAQELSTPLSTTVEGIDRQLDELSKYTRDLKKTAQRNRTAGGQIKNRKKYQQYQDEIRQVEANRIELERTKRDLLANAPQPFQEGGLLTRSQYDEYLQAGIKDPYDGVVAYSPVDRIYQVNFNKFIREAIEAGELASEAEWYDFANKGSDLLDIDARARQAVQEASEIAGRKIDSPITETSYIDRVSNDPMTGFDTDFSTLKRNKVISFINDLYIAARGISKKEVSATEINRQLRTEIRETKRTAEAVVKKAESAANYLRSWARQASVQAFDIEPGTGRILNPELQDRVILSDGNTVLASPTISDVAARLDTYTQFMNEDQIRFMGELRNVLEDGVVSVVKGTEIVTPGWNTVLRNGLHEWNPSRIRKDIEPGGFYIHRGPIKIGKEVETFEESIEDLLSLESRPTYRGKIGAEKAAEREAMGSVKPSNTAKPGVAQTGDNIIKSEVVYESFDKTMEKFINDVAARISGIKTQKNVLSIGDSVDDVAEKVALDKRLTAQGGEFAGRTDVLVSEPIAKAIRNEFIGNPLMANLNKVARVKILRNLNSIYRGIKSGWDLSPVGIQGLLALYKNPVLWWKSFQLSVRACGGGSFGSKRLPQQVYDEMLSAFDARAVESNMPTADIYASQGLRIGGAAVEAAMPISDTLFAGSPRLSPQGIIRGGFERSNIAFGIYGDSLRLNWANELVSQELNKGRTIKELIESGDFEQIVQSANDLTGWSDRAFLGDVGQALTFAPRFLQSRINTVVQAHIGIARFATRREQTIKSREAAKAVVRMIGLGVAFTEITNAALGNETDRRPVVNGRFNPNFYRIRYGGQDFSVFGPYIGLVGAMANVLEGDFSAAYRNLSSGTVRVAWDVLTGYDPVDTETPIGIFRRPQTVKWEDQADDDTPWMEKQLEDVKAERKLFSRDPEVWAIYFAELALPIAPQQVIGQAFRGATQIPGALRGEEVAAERIRGSAIAAPIEWFGGQVTPVSRGDVRNQIAQELYNKSWEDLGGQAKREVDRLVDKTEGEIESRGEEGPLIKEREKINQGLIAETKRIADLHLSASIFQPGWNIKTAHKLLKNARNKHRLEVERINVRLYGDEREKPDDKDSPEYLLWLYGNTFEESLDKEGKLDFELLDEKQAKFWGSLSREQAEEVLSRIRNLEPEFDPRIQNMIDAQRFAGAFKMQVPGVSEEISYYDIEDLPEVRSAIARNSGESLERVNTYFTLSEEEREDMVSYDETIAQIDKVVESASRGNGFIANIKNSFIFTAVQRPEGRAWLQAMFEAGYEFQGKAKLQENLKEQLKTRGEELSPKNYAYMYLNELNPK